MTAQISLHPHAAERITGRLSSLVTLRQVAHAVAHQDFQVGQTFVEVRRLPEHIEFMDGEHRIQGDVICAVVSRTDGQAAPEVTTVLLRHSTQPSRAYRTWDDVPESQRPHSMRQA